jgi:hypothetical protein
MNILVEKHLGVLSSKFSDTILSVLLKSFYGLIYKLCKSKANILQAASKILAVIICKGELYRESGVDFLSQSVVIKAPPSLQLAWVPRHSA